MIIGGIERAFNAAPKGRVRYGIAPPPVQHALPTMARISEFRTDEDQGQGNSCVEFSIAEQAEHATGDRYSKLFGWWFSRIADGDKPTDDVGLSIQDALGVASHIGMCLEATWPYHLDLFSVPPPVNAVIEASQNRITRVDPVANLDVLRFEIARGQATLFGFSVPSTFDSDSTARDGVVLFTPDATSVGRHCVNAIAYDDEKKLIACTTHYGPDFGDHGCIWLPYSAWDAGHPADISDMFCVRSVGAP